MDGWWDVPSLDGMIVRAAARAAGPARSRMGIAPGRPARLVAQPADRAPRPRGRQASLRHRQRPVPADARPSHGLQLRLLARSRRPRRRAGSQARSRLPQARFAPRHARARHRLRLGRGAGVRGAPIWRQRGRRDHFAGTGRLRAAACAPALPIEIRLQDYRELHERFDRVFSIGMFEHVGVRNYRSYFEVAQAVPGRRAGNGRRTVPAAQHRQQPIAPAHRSVDRALHLPEFDAALRRADRRRAGRAVRDRGLARIRHRLRSHPEAWRDNIESAWDQLPGYGERFRRMWRFYLAASMATFRTRRAQLVAAGVVAARRSRRIHRPTLIDECAARQVPASAFTRVQRNRWINDALHEEAPC